MTLEKIGLLMGGADHGMTARGGRLMRLELVSRPERSRLLSLLSPLIASR